MRKTPVSKEKLMLPSQFESFVKDAAVYDSSSSKEAAVYFIDRDGGYYLKCSDKGALSREAMMTKFFSQKGLAAEVTAYESLEKDWLLTKSVKGEDCVGSIYLEVPERLCDTLAELLITLHAADTSDCPIRRMKEYFELVRKNYLEGRFDSSYGPDGINTPEDAIALVEEKRHLFKEDTLIHGDCCLPNIILDNWKFSSFIDLDHAGVGDRHVDIYWAIWSMNFNFKTDKYLARFIDAYGKDRVNGELLRVIAAAECFG